MPLHPLDVDTDVEAHDDRPLPACDVELPWPIDGQPKRARSSEPTQLPTRLHKANRARGPRTLQRRHADASAADTTLTDVGVGGGWPRVLTADDLAAEGERSELIEVEQS